MPKEPSEQKNARAGAGGGRFFRSWERHVWYARGGYGGANAIQSPKLVDWGLTKDSRHLSTSSSLRDTVVTRWIIMVWAPGSIPGGENPFFSYSRLNFSNNLSYTDTLSQAHYLRHTDLRRAFLSNVKF